MVQSELSAFDALRRLSLDLIDYRSRHYRRALTLDQAKQLQNSLLNYKNKLWDIKQRNGNRGKGVLNSTSSNVLLGRQMLFVNFETQQVHSPNIRSGQFTIPDKKLILLRQVVFRDLNVDVLARIISNDNDGYNDLVGSAATQKSLALASSNSGHSAKAGLDFSTLVDSGAEINISITKSGTDTTTSRKKAPVIFGAGGTAAKSTNRQSFTCLRPRDA